MYENYEEKIFEGVYNANQEYGFSSLTTKLISKVCDVSEGSFYRHFDSKEDMLFKAYVQVDKKIAELMSGVELPKLKSTFLIPKKAILSVVKKQFWDPYLEFFLTHPKEGLFYINYVEAYGDNQEQMIANGGTTKGYYGDFLGNINSLDSAISIFKKVDSVIFWTALIDSTLTYAKKLILGRIENTKENKDAIFNMIFSGVISIV